MGCALMRRFSALAQDELVLVLVVVEVAVVVVQVPPAVSEVRRLAVSRRRLWHLLCADARAVRLSVFPALGCNNLALCNVSGDTPAYMFFAQVWEFKLVVVSHVFKCRFEERVLQQCGWGGVFATF